jgi:hypothetical protein
MYIYAYIIRQAAWHLFETEVKGVAGLQKEDIARGWGGEEGGGRWKGNLGRVERTQSTYRGRVEIGGEYLPSQLECAPQFCT